MIPGVSVDPLPAHPASPRRNRVTPWGAIVAVPERGGILGNRGVLHDEHQRMGNRRWTTHAWIACRMDYRGIKRPVAPPGRWTALFFLDDAAALAAGHRPCAFCRRADFLRFKRTWADVHGAAMAPAMDARLHRERVGPRPLVDPRTLPDDAFVGGPEACWRIAGGRGRPWSWSGYGPPIDLASASPLPLLTPPAIVALLRAGYRPGVGLM
jgi:hypothetical protein